MSMKIPTQVVAKETAEVNGGSKLSVQKVSQTEVETYTSPDKNSV